MIRPTPSTRRAEPLSAEDRADFREPFVVDSKPSPLASLFSVENPCGDELTEVVADRWLRLAEQLWKVTCTTLPCGSDDAHELQADRIGESLQDRRKFVSVEIAQGFCAKRGTTEFGHVIHRTAIVSTTVDVLTFVDMKISY
jgi:hypothetical protein